METSIRRKWAIMTVASTLALAGVATTSCRDSSTSTVTTATVQLTENRSGDASSRDRIHALNREDWIGEAHNRALDDFRKELRKSGKMPRLCDYLADLVAREDHLPSDKRGRFTRNQTAQRDSVIKAQFCSKKSRSGAQNVLFVPAIPQESGLETASPTALALLDRIDVAIVETTDSYDLSGRLAPILNEASVLDSTDQFLVLGALSTAQHSLEYWESVWPQFSQEVRDEYLECINASRLLTEEMDCTGKELVFDTRQSSSNPLALVTRQDPCLGFNGAWDGIKKTAQSDKDGFIGGFFGALTTTRNVPIALVAGVGGAAGKSAVTGTGVTIHLFKCAMGWQKTAGKT
jgi:hypothetical protein